ncbi:MAG: TolC family protein [Bacteroidales bacterium]|nr:TolC family protein [Bacteroidales bacterium]
MKKLLIVLMLLGIPAISFAQMSKAPDDSTLYLTLEDALKIALSENISVKVADREVTRSEYALKGTYASLFPQIDASASYQRTIKKQVMYMDFDMSAITGGAMGGDDVPAAQEKPGAGASGGGIEVGRWNTFSAGVSAGMPLVNAALWKSIRISGQDVELAVEKARGSRLSMVSEVKSVFFAILLAKQALSVYEEVYENAVENFRITEMRYNVQKASELDYTRAKAAVSNAIPPVNESLSSIALSLWQLKAVIGLDLETDIDVVGNLDDYADEMFRAIHENDDATLENNSSLRQLAIQAEELANMIKLQQAAYLPTLALSFSYSLNAMTNDFKFSEYNWSPYSFVGLSLQIPIFSGGKRASNVKQAKIQYDELKLQEMDAERQLKIAIRQYLNQMETQMKSYSAAQDAMTTAQKAYDIASKSYSIGRSTLTDLNDAQLALTQAELSLCQTVYNFMIAKTNLEQTLGNDFLE